MQNILLQVQVMLGQFESYQQQFQFVVQQKQKVQFEFIEVKKVFDEIESFFDDVVVYKIVGIFIVKIIKDKVVVELKEKIEIFEVCLNVFERQEKKFNEKFKEFIVQIQLVLRLLIVG